MPGIELTKEGGHPSFVEEAERYLGAGGEAAQGLHLMGDLVEKASSLHLRPDTGFKRGRGNRGWGQSGRGKPGHEGLGGDRRGAIPTAQRGNDKASQHGEDNDDRYDQ
jgi:hypothetical protein